MKKFRYFPARILGHKLLVKSEYNIPKDVINVDSICDYDWYLLDNKYYLVADKWEHERNLKGLITFSQINQAEKAKYHLNHGNEYKLLRQLIKFNQLPMDCYVPLTNYYGCHFVPKSKTYTEESHKNYVYSGLEKFITKKNISVINDFDIIRKICIDYGNKQNLEYSKLGYTGDCSFTQEAFDVIKYLLNLGFVYSKDINGYGLPLIGLGLQIYVRKNGSLMGDVIGNFDKSANAEIKLSKRTVLKRIDNNSLSDYLINRGLGESIYPDKDKLFQEILNELDNFNKEEWKKNVGFSVPNENMPKDENAEIPEESKVYITSFDKEGFRITKWGNKILGVWYDDDDTYFDDERKEIIYNKINDLYNQN
jgi:hypothetical protein